MQRLADRMSVPGGATPGSKPHPNRFEVRGRRCAHDFIEPNRSREIRFGSFAAGMKFGGEDLHGAAHFICNNCRAGAISPISCEAWGALHAPFLKERRMEFLHVSERRVGRPKTFWRIWTSCASPGLLVRGKPCTSV